LVTGLRRLRQLFLSPIRYSTFSRNYTFFIPQKRIFAFFSKLYLQNSYEEKLHKNNYIGVLGTSDWGGISYDTFPKGCAKADVKIVVGFPDEIPTEMEFIAGFVGYSENENKDIVPEINWVVRKK
jgi:hypothetical protein